MHRGSESPAPLHAGKKYPQNSRVQSQTLPIHLETLA